MAPVAVMTVAVPSHVVVLPLKVISGRLFTVTVAEALAIQPKALLTVTEYDWLETGETVRLLPVLPVFHS